MLIVKYFDFVAMDKKKFNIILGTQIRIFREEKNITQAELSALMNINSQNISSYERGERCPSIYWITKLCKALEINPVHFHQEFYSRLIED